MKEYVIILAAVSVLSGTAFAGQEPECADLSLPNFLDIGKCLKLSGDLCSADITDIGRFLYKLGQCTFLGVGKLDLGSQVYLIQEFLKYLLERNDFNVALPLLTDICDRLSNIVSLVSAGLIEISCDELTFSKEALCGEPIFLSLPTTAPFGMCLNETGLTCAGDTAVDELAASHKFSKKQFYTETVLGTGLLACFTQEMPTFSLEPAVVGFLRVLACLLSYIFTTAPSEVTKTLGCGLIIILNNLLAAAGSSPLRPFICAVQSAVNVTCIRC